MKRRRGELLPRWVVLLTVVAALAAGLTAQSWDPYARTPQVVTR